MTTEDIARIIFDVVYVPGEDGTVLPPFDEAKSKGMGGYHRAMDAAEKVRTALSQ